MILLEYEKHIEHDLPSHAATRDEEKLSSRLSPRDSVVYKLAESLDSASWMDAGLYIFLIGMNSRKESLLIKKIPNTVETGRQKNLSECTVL